MLQKILVSSFFFFLLFVSFGQFPRSIQSEMSRLNLNQVLLLPNYAIDEYPLWSEDSKEIGVNIMGQWYKMTLEETVLIEADWLNHVIGYNNYYFIDTLKESELISFKNNTVFDPRKIQYENGSFYELRMTNFSTSFIYSNEKGIEKILWETNGDNCHSLSKSPDGNFLAFISESNGLMLYVLNKNNLNSEISSDENIANEIINVVFKGNLKKAEKLVDKELKTNPENSEVNVIKWYIHYNDGNNKSALKRIESALKTEPNRPFYHYAIAETYFLLKKYDQSIIAYQKFLTYRPYHYYVYYDMGNVYKSANNKDLACKMYTKFESIHKGKATAEIRETCEN